MWMEIRKNKILIEIIMENGDGNMEIVKTVMEKMTVSLKNYQHCKELRLESLYFGGSPTTHLVFPTESILSIFLETLGTLGPKKVDLLDVTLVCEDG